MFWVHYRKLGNSALEIADYILWLLWTAINVFMYGYFALSGNLSLFGYKIGTQQQPKASHEAKRSNVVMAKNLPVRCNTLDIS